MPGQEKTQTQLVDWTQRVDREPFAVVAEILTKTADDVEKHNSTCESCPRPKREQRAFMADVILPTLKAGAGQSLIGADMLLTAKIEQVKRLSDLPADNPDRLKAASNLADGAYTHAALLRMAGAILESFARAAMFRKNCPFVAELRKLAEDCRVLDGMLKEAQAVTPNPPAKPTLVRIN